MKQIENISDQFTTKVSLENISDQFTTSGIGGWLQRGPGKKIWMHREGILNLIRAYFMMWDRI